MRLLAQSGSAASTTCRTRPQAVPLRPLAVSPDEGDEQVGGVPVGLDGDVRPAADRVAEGAQELEQDGDRVRLGVRQHLGRHLAGKSVEGGEAERHRPRIGTG